MTGFGRGCFSIADWCRGQRRNSEIETAPGTFRAPFLLLPSLPVRLVIFQVTRIEHIAEGAGRFSWVLPLSPSAGSRLVGANTPGAGLRLTGCGTLEEPAPKMLGPLNCFCRRFLTHAFLQFLDARLLCGAFFPPAGPPWLVRDHRPERRQRPQRLQPRIRQAPRRPDCRKRTSTPQSRS